MKIVPKIVFENGTITVSNIKSNNIPRGLVNILKYDDRTKNFRARGCDYSAIVTEFMASAIKCDDSARKFSEIDITLVKDIIPRPHQRKAFETWKNNTYRGVTALPTGAGKTILAVMAIAQLKRPTIILVPTIDLLHQWVSVLEKFFGEKIGMLGGGEHDILPITVSTYDSAVIHMEFVGNKFCFLIADECHHLPGPVIQNAAAMCIAPFRLGLSATPDLGDERDEIINDLLGDIVCRIHIDELEGKYLSPYVTRRIAVELDPDELEEYNSKRAIYTDFLRRHGISFRHQSDWGRFLMLCARQPDGRKVLNAFFTQRKIARGGRAKVRTVWDILVEHAGEQTIIFTADNASAYLLGREFALPVLTHQTGARERKEMLDTFRAGDYPVLVTSRVLNEGVDVPSVGVGIVLSGTGSVREHVQRLGRILRPAPGKEQAVLYELISAGTSEEGVSARRREHRAYRNR